MIILLIYFSCAKTVQFINPAFFLYALSLWSTVSCLSTFLKCPGPGMYLYLFAYIVVKLIFFSDLFGVLSIPRHYVFSIAAAVSYDPGAGPSIFGMAQGLFPVSLSGFLPRCAAKSLGLVVVSLLISVPL